MPLGLDDHRLGDVERVRNAEKRFQGVALRAAGRAPVAGLVAHEHVEVAQSGDGGGRDSGTVVAHGDERDLIVGAGADVDNWCSTGGFGGVERVVEQLLDDDVPERFLGLPGLRLQGAQFQKLCGPRGGEHGALHRESLTAVQGDGVRRHRPIPPTSSYTSWRSAPPRWCRGGQRVGPQDRRVADCEEMQRGGTATVDHRLGDPAAAAPVPACKVYDVGAVVG